MHRQTKMRGVLKQRERFITQVETDHCTPQCATGADDMDVHNAFQISILTRGVASVLSTTVALLIQLSVFDDSHDAYNDQQDSGNTDP